MRRLSSEPRPTPLRVSRAATLASDATTAVEELVRALDDRADLVLCFVSPRYDRSTLGPALGRAFPRAVVVGCTTAGQIGEHGYQASGITATALRGVYCDALLIRPLDARVRDLDALSLSVMEQLQTFHGRPNTVGLLLADGLRMVEERLIAALYAATGAIPVVGGSAGDDLAFEETFVLHEGAFHTNAAVLCMIASPTPVSLLSFAHHRPSGRRMVITDADPEQRLVCEIDGSPAALAYARMVGVPEAELGPDVFSKHPLMLPIHGGHYIRSIQKNEPDGSLRLYCAIERGLVLRLAEPARVLETAVDAFDAAEVALGGPADVILGSDCVLRRLELESLGMREEVGALLARRNVVGFSTYGEQLNGVHVNQTFVGIALRGER